MLSLGELIEFFEIIESPCLEDSDMLIWDLNEPEIIDDFEGPLPEEMLEEPEYLEDFEYPDTDYPEDPEIYYEDIPYEYLSETYSEYYEMDKIPFPVEEDYEKEILELLNLLEQERPDEKEILELLNLLEQERPDEKEILELLDSELNQNLKNN